MIARPCFLRPIRWPAATSVGMMRPIACGLVALLGGCRDQTCDWPDPAPEEAPPENTNDSPIQGIWSETEWLDCFECALTEPDKEVRELIFHDDGRFWVTWFPFETYVDYWGDYTWDEKTGELQLEIDGGNDVPGRFIGEGTATITPSGALVLDGIWLGSGQAGENVCGHRFEFISPQ